jgi:hypothetical protein
MAKKNNSESSEYTLEGQEIKRVQKLKHLGITYQENNKINLDERLLLLVLLPSMHRLLYMRFFQVSTEIAYRRFAGVVQVF